MTPFFGLFQVSVFKLALLSSPRKETSVLFLIWRRSENPRWGEIYIRDGRAMKMPAAGRSVSFPLAGGCNNVWNFPSLCVYLRICFIGKVFPSFFFVLLRICRLLLLLPGCLNLLLIHWTPCSVFWFSASYFRYH